MKQFDFEVIASGSKGNAVRIEDIMIDCGVPFNKMKESLYGCSTLLITHSHTDHLNVKTLNQIIRSFPVIFIGCNAETSYYVPADKIFGEKPFRLKNGVLVTPLELKHNVQTHGFVLEFDDKKVIYATDTSEMPEIDDKFDYLFLESNYDEYKLKAMSRSHASKGYDPLMDSTMRHLSYQQSKYFYLTHRVSKDSPWIELHQSSRFY